MPRRAKLDGVRRCPKSGRSIRALADSEGGAFLLRMADIFVGTVLGAAVLRPSYASVRRMQKAIAAAGGSFHDGSCRHPEHLLTGQLRQRTNRR